MDQQTDKKYLNWITATLALRQVKKGVTEFTNENVSQLHAEISKKLSVQSVTAVSTKCSECRYHDVVKVKDRYGHRRWKWRVNCRSNICSVWLDEILQYHVHSPHPNVVWTNCNPSLWPSDPWEVAKVFQGHGCGPHGKAEDSDCAALLTLIQDCTFLSKFVSNRNLVQEVKMYRNLIMHSAHLEVESSSLEVWLDKMIELLEDPKHFSQLNACQRAAAEIKKLKDVELNLSLCEGFEEKALKDRIKAMEHDVEQLRFKSEQLRSDISELCTNQSDSSEDHSALQQQINALQATITQVLQENQILTRSLQDKDNSVLDETISDLTRRLQDLATGGKADSDKLTHLEFRLKSLQQNVESRLDSIEERQHSLEESVLLEIQKQQKTIPTEVTDVQRHLLSLYGKHCQKVPIYPLKPTLKRQIENLYVKPCLKVIDPRGRCLHFDRQAKDRKANETHGSEQRLMEMRISSVKDIFYSDGKLCRDIYVVGEAGVGKSTLCEHLVNVWCKTHSVDICNMTKECFMEQFPLLFYISLKEVDKSIADCDHIVTMVQNQLLLTEVNVSEILIKQNCLVLVDGLDEWCPQDGQKYSRFEVKGVPRRHHSDHCTVLTTSRPWKLEAIGPELEGNIDRLVLITGLENEGADELAKNVINILNADHFRNKNSKDFIQDMQEKDLHQFLQTPVLLMQMLCLWYTGNPFGDSQTEIYVRMIDKQFEITEMSRDLLEHTTACHKKDIWQDSIAMHLRDTPYCLQYQDILWKLSKIAFETLLTSNRETSLVFDHKQTEILGMAPEEVEMCLKVGLLTQSKVYGEITDDLKTISFIHKTHHEFFAALYLANQNDSSLLNRIFTETVQHLDQVLELEKVLVFIAGLNPYFGHTISEHIMKIVCKDPRVRKYRIDWQGYKSPHYTLIVRIQNMILDCLQESRKCGFTGPTLELQDVDIEENCYANLLARWENLDVTNARSVRIVTPFDATVENVEHWDRMLLRWFSSCLQKLHICDYGQVIRNESLHQVLIGANSSIESFGLRSVELTSLGNRLIGMLALPKLTSFGFVTGVKVTHEQLDGLAKMWASSSQLEEFCLERLECTTHRYGSCRYTLDMSSHKHLRKLKLIWLNATKIEFDARQLISCKLGWMYIPGAAKSALACLENAANLEILCCSGCKHSQDVNALIDTLGTGLVSLKRLRIKDVDFGDRQQLRLSPEMKNLESVRLGVGFNDGIVVKNDALMSAIESLPPQRVDVQLRGMEIRMETGGECAVEFVRRSANFTVTADSVRHTTSCTSRLQTWHVKEFSFHTMDQG